MIDDFSQSLDIKTSGIEIQVDRNKGGQMGDLYVTKTGLTWCKGKQSKANGVSIRWDKFADYMESL